MNTKNHAMLRLLPIAAVAALCFGLQGCIQRDAPVDSGSTTGGETTGGETTGGDGGGTPSACANLPAAATTYKGGDTLGEELSVALDPSTLAYTITVDASLQRSAGTQRSGTLTQIDGCTYTSSENGAVFTIGAGGLVQGGIAAAEGTSFAPLIAFATTYNNAGDPTAFNDVALIFNAAGVAASDGTTAGYGGSGRLRNAGTMQFCVDAANGGFATYASSCSNTQKGYVTWNADRGAFDFYETDPAGSAVTSGGDLHGSLIIGMVDSTEVPLMLLRESATRYGLRLLTLQDTLAAGAADGDYVTIDSSGSNGAAAISGSDLTHDTASATLAYDTPAAGVVEASGALGGHLLYAGGVYGFVPTTAGAAAFEFGLLQ